MDELERLEEEYAEFLKTEAWPLVKLPPGTKTQWGRDVGGQWLWAAFVTQKIWAYHHWYKKQLEEKIAALRGVRSLASDNGQK